MQGDWDFGGTDRFEVVRRLGAGGMGVVYEALDRERNTRVALKTLRNLDAQGILLFKKEFRALQDVQHPNLISLGELIEEGGQWFFTMELVRGVDFLMYVRPSGYKPEDDSTSSGGRVLDSSPLSDTTPFVRVNGRGSFPRIDDTRLRGSMVQLARGLVSLHANHKVHRDIKPSNILVTPAGRVVLLDFGLVTDLAASVSAENVLVGTVAYMAPEQAAFQRVGPEADWYSVGVLLYFALTGQLPFDGHATQILMRKQREPPAAPSAITPTKFPDLEALCVEMLRIEPAARPSGHEILRRLEGDRPATLSVPPPAKSKEPFIGRRDELAMLRRAFDETRGGRAIVVCVHGESGVGKSALVKRFTESFASDDEPVVVLSGRCYERESVPYKAVDGIIDALSHLMARLGEEITHYLLPRMAALLPQVFPVLGRVEGFAQTLPPAGLELDAQELRTRAFAALRELFGRIASWRPLVLVIDDFQWADADSIALLVELLRPPDAPPLLLVCTVRSEGAGRLPVSVPGEVRYVKLGRLSPHEAFELAEELVAVGQGFGSEPPSGRLSAASIAKEADGHPLFIDELVRHSRRMKRTADLHLDEALWSRVGRLEDGARRLLEVVCVAGAPIEVAIAARAVRTNDFTELGQRVTALRGANFVRTTGGRGADAIEPYHDRVAEAVVANLDPETRRDCHERIAMALEDLGRDDAEALAAHFAAAGHREKGARYAKLAARQAESTLAFDRAAALFRLAIDLGPGGPGEARALRTGLAHALANAGRGHEAAAEFLAAVDDANPTEALDLRRRAADQLLRSGHIDDGLVVLRSVLERVGMRLPRTHNGALASLLWEKAQLALRGQAFTVRGATELDAAALQRIDICWSVTLGLSLVDFIRAADFQTRTMRLALDAGCVDRLSRSFAMAACFGVSEGGGARKRAPRLLETADILARRTGSPYALAWIPLSKGIAEFMEGKWKRCLALTAEAEALFHKHGRGVAWELASAKTYGIWALGYLGEWKELGRRIDDGLHEARERGDRFAAIHMRTGAAHYVHLAKDNPDEARRDSTDALREWSHEGFRLQHVLDLFVQAEADLYEGNAAKSHATILREWPKVDGAMFLRIQNARIFMLDLRARAELALAVERGKDESLLRAAERNAKLVEAEQMGWGVALAWALLAGVAHVRGDVRRAAAMLERAGAAFEAADMGVHAASVRRRRGEILGGDAGRALIARASEEFARQEIRSAARMTAMLTPGFGR